MPGISSDPHALAAAEVARVVGVDVRSGLASGEASERLRTFGPNVVRAEKRPSLVSLLWRSATEPFVLLLALAGGLAIVLGEVRDGLLILAGLVPIVGADLVTGYRAERAMQELRAAAAPVARIRRDARVLEIRAEQLVPGDVVLLRVGDIVPADLRLVRSEALQFDRSVLTGESLPESGSIEPDDAATPLASRRSIAYAGTAVVLGRGEGIAVATGRATEFGRIQTALSGAVRRRSPLQRELDRLVRILLVAAGALIALTTATALVRHRTIGEALLAGISAAIAAIPEEPPVLLAVVLGLGAYRLLKRRVLVRRLNAQETLAAVDLVITDKTGTLTENRLTLEAVLTPDRVVEGANRGRLVRDALRAEEDAWGTEAGDAPGSFTRALLADPAAAGDRIRLDPTALVESSPPREGRPYSVTVSRADAGALVERLAIGAPEALLAATAEADRRRWSQLVEDWATAGRRLLLLVSASETSWKPLAVLVFSDRLRPGVGEALDEARRAGIQTVMVTGDHPVTAKAIAEQAGIGPGEMVLGEHLETWSDERLSAALPRLAVVARAVPAHKLRLVHAAQRTRRTVAVTGDGLNDAPALEHADVGVAMGSGTAVAKEASDLVLGDDSFVTLMEGLREGRRIVANVQKGLVFLLSTHVALLGFILIATLAGSTQPLLPLQILWLELFIDLSTSVAFEREPAEPGSMERPPRPSHEPLLSRGLLLRLSGAGSFTAVAALVLMVTHGGGPDHERWLAYTALVVGQAVRAYANRSLTAPLHRLPPNPLLAIACFAVVGAQLAIPMIPALSDAFRATQLDAVDLVLVAVIALAPAAVAEVIRTTRRQEWVA